MMLPMTVQTKRATSTTTKMMTAASKTMNVVVDDTDSLFDGFQRRIRPVLMVETETILPLVPPVVEGRNPSQ
jgi:hypothetical protein